MGASGPKDSQTTLRESRGTPNDGGLEESAAPLAAISTFAPAATAS